MKATTFIWEQHFGQTRGSISRIRFMSMAQVCVERLRIGSRAKVHFDAYPDLELPARVYSVGGIARQGGQRATYVKEIPIKLKLEKTDPRVIPDLSVSADVLLADTAGRERILKEKLTKVWDHYDHILIDNPPSLSLISINSLVASDHYIITVTPSFLSQVALHSLLETVDVIKKNMNARVDLLGILVTMADLRLKVTSEILEILRESFGDKVFKSVIRQNVRLLEAPSHGQTIFEYDSGSVGALCYMYFGKEFLSKCQS